MSKFVHLHTHSHYSLLDGLSKVGPLVDRAKELGMDALAITDHGNLYGAVEFYKKAKKEGIKAIIGVEAYVAVGSRFSKKPREDAVRFHLTLLVNCFALITLVKLKKLLNFIMRFLAMIIIWKFSRTTPTYGQNL